MAMNRQDTTKPQAVDDLGFCVLVGPAGAHVYACVMAGQKAVWNL